MARIDPRTWLRSSRLRRYDPEYIRSVAEIYWHALLVTGVAISLCTLIYAWQEFSAIQTGRPFDAANEATTSKKDIDRAELQATLDVFKVRAKRFEALEASKEVIPDPSR